MLVSVSVSQWLVIVSGGKLAVSISQRLVSGYGQLAFRVSQWLVLVSNH